ncbi:MAG TPA: tetratricopeptide repeat protein, partial [Bacteroidales bacterium]|nr:tetratricopeptide repeat protein [Bacteroidales bacterium]
NYNYYLDRANAYTRIFELEKAIINYEKAIKIKPDFANAWFNMGKIKLKSKKIDEAIYCFTKVIDLSPSDSEAYYERGNALIELGQNIEACEDFTKAYNLGFSKAYMSITKYCNQLKNIEKQ